MSNNQLIFTNTSEIHFLNLNLHNSSEIALDFLEILNSNVCLILCKYIFAKIKTNTPKFKKNIFFVIQREAFKNLSYYSKFFLHQWKFQIF